MSIFPAPSDLQDPPIRWQGMEDPGPPTTIDDLLAEVREFNLRFLEVMHKERERVALRNRLKEWLWRKGFRLEWQCPEEGD